MSRIGKQPVTIASGVQVTLADGKITVKGPNGTLEQAIPDGMTVSQEDGAVIIKRRDDSKSQKALHGLTRALIQNAVTGVTAGFKKDLEIHGVGYRADVKGKNVVFALGYSHPIEFPIPEGIKVAIDKNTLITVTGADRQQVGQVAAEMRALRPPDVYKLKGVRYADEQLRKKAGKSGAQ
ncbi:50S ribosomal protein L6 [Acidobacteria bacterium Mor1]|nr:50S ribosomal protein L6 [Acidobacteria bacterium Mor1]